MVVVVGLMPGPQMSGKAESDAPVPVRACSGLGLIGLLACLSGAVLSSPSTPISLRSANVTAVFSISAQDFSRITYRGDSGLYIWVAIAKYDQGGYPHVIEEHLRDIQVGPGCFPWL